MTYRESLEKQLLASDDYETIFRPLLKLNRDGALKVLASAVDTATIYKAQGSFAAFDGLLNLDGTVEIRDKRRAEASEREHNVRPVTGIVEFRPNA